MSFESQAKEWQASAMLHLSGTVHGHIFWVHELLQQKILYYSCILYQVHCINNPIILMHRSPIPMYTYFFIYTQV